VEGGRGEGDGDGVEKGEHSLAPGLRVTGHEKRMWRTGNSLTA
jgi:hypothetical protein